MRQIHVTALVVLAALALPATAPAQRIFGRGMQGVPDRAIEGRATDDDVYTCAAAPGGSRIRPNCEVETETATFQMQQQLRIALNPPPLPAAQCGAATTTEYRQLDTIARVNGTLEIRDCTAASGAFTVAAVVKDESGEEKPLEFSETWQRSDDNDVSFAGDYPIGENVELVSVRLTGLTCTCTDLVAEEEPATAEH
ncbi:MAG TPA: hypothetical protein VLI71_06985 [Gammaproteobacteria bacterium]|nr:hypothetical protein [Gammaproteobacteria bacterium]